MYTRDYMVAMASSDVVTLRLPPAVSKRLARLAKSTARTRSRLAADAIEKYLDDNAWQIEAIEEGIRDVEAGRVHTHAEVRAWVESWGTKSPRRRRK
jgi:RHH-type transcriptional regulator, rel operon repressor / antitoxin RelB